MRQLKISKQITNRQDVSLDKYLQEISKISMITAEQEVELAIKIREGDQIALNTLAMANLRFVVSVAKQYQNQGLTLPDLINEGNLGLVKAAQRFDETRGFKFISYAVWWVRQGIIQALAEQSRIVRLPLNKIGAINKISRASAMLEQSLERQPSADEISEVVDISLDEIKQCMKNSSRHLSMDAPLREGEDSNFYDVMKSSESVSPDENLFIDSLKIEINTVLNALTGKEKEIVCLYYGIGGQNSLTLDEIGCRLDLTRERVRQIREKAIIKLKTANRANILLKYLG